MLAGCALAGCLTPPRMCASETDCGSQAACVAGRCVAQGATVAIDTARRVLVPPVDVAYLRRGSQAVAAVGALGGGSAGGAAILVRFSLDLPPEAVVLEAYLVLERATDRDLDPGWLALRTARIVDPWESRSISWARQPRVSDVGSPVTSVGSSSGPVVRLDVRGMVERWRRRRGDDFGLAVAAAGPGTTTMAFVLAPTVPVPSFSPLSDGRDDPILAPSLQAAAQLSPFEPHPALVSAVADPRRELVGPRLELYVK